MVYSGDTRHPVWRTAWIDGVDQWGHHWAQDFRISQNEGTGLIAQGTEDWTDYRASVSVNTLLATEAGVAVRVGGMRPYCALLLGADGMARTGTGVRRADRAGGNAVRGRSGASIRTERWR